MSYTDKDILCGRGGNVIHHSGNKHYRSLIAAKKDRYLQGSLVDKKNLVQSIFNDLHVGGYHFLEFNKESSKYEPVKNERVVKKRISQCFREKDKKKNAWAKAKLQHVTASIPADDDHLSNTSSSQGSSSFQRSHQSNQSPLKGVDHLGNVSASCSVDGSVITDNDTDSGSSVPTLMPLRFPSSPFPAALLTHNYTNDNVFSWCTERSDDAMQRPDVGKEMIVAFLRKNVRETHVSKPDFFNQ